MRNAKTACAFVLALGVSALALEPRNVLLVYNSRNADSAGAASAYLAARPGVVAFDLNSTALNTGSLSRADYLSLIREPVRTFINGRTAAGAITGPDLSQQIIAIATTIGLPARVLSPAGGADEFQLYSAWASVESELVLLQQDLEASGPSPYTNRYRGFVENPWHTRLNQRAGAFSRASVQVQRPFTLVRFTGATSESIWHINGLTPGDMYLVCRLDSAATPGVTTARQNTQALITRSTSLTLDRCAVQALLDEFQAPNNVQELEFDQGELPPFIAGPQDFEHTASFLSALGVATLHDQTTNFVTGPELPDQTRPLAVLGTYGENHSAYAGSGENPPGDGTYITTYSFAPASFFIAYESWGGTSLYAPGTSRGNQQQALNFIARGGSFTIATVMEPFTFAIADLQFLLPNMLVHGLTYAEAAYASIPVLSWQSTPVGDPLARISLTTDPSADARLNVDDLYADALAPRDHDCNGVVNSADAAALRRAVRSAEQFDVVPLAVPLN
jgi:hypothetical protein